MAPGGGPDVPESVQGIIGARLDLLAPAEKRLPHDAAVIGKVFWPRALAALGGTPGGAELDESLYRLERKQFLRCHARWRAAFRSWQPLGARGLLRLR